MARPEDAICEKIIAYARRMQVSRKPQEPQLKNWDRRENGNWALVEEILSVMIGVVEYTASSGNLLSGWKHPMMAC